MAAIVGRRYISNNSFRSYQCYFAYYRPTQIYLYRSEPSTTHYKYISHILQIALVQPNNIIVNITSRDLQLVWIGIKIWSIKYGLGLSSEHVQQLTGPEQWLKNVDRWAVGHAPDMTILMMYCYYCH